MNAAIEKTLNHLTAHHFMSEVSTDQLNQLVADYPYFGPAQFLLAYKLKEDNNYLATTQLQKTGLYFNNINWLQYQFNEDAHKEPILPKPVSSLNEPATSIIDTSLHTSVDVIDTEAVIEPIEENILKTNPHFPNIDIPTIEEVKGMMQGIDVKKETLEPLATSIQDKALHDEKVESIPYYSPSEIFTKAFVEPVPTLDVYDTALTEEEAAENDSAKTPNDLKISRTISNQFADFKSELKQPVSEETKLDFEREPYYTIDYFASQGIKVDLTKQPQDKLTRQLLKFTDWLKYVKKTNANPKDLGTDPALETAVQNIALSSNDSREVVTETMAEVFVKQGMIEKAIQLYIKLSFLNPSKTAYFAARIQEIKGI